MKATFFYLATLAASVFAVPTQVTHGAISEANGIVSGLGLGKVANGVAAPIEKRAGYDIVSGLGGALGKVQTQTGYINGTLIKVQDGKMSKEAGEADVTRRLQGLLLVLTGLVAELLSAAGVDIKEGDLAKVVNLVVALLSEILFTVKSLLTVLGLRPAIASLLSSIINLVVGLLRVLVGLLAGLLPALVAALTPILAIVGDGVLGPLLTPITAALAMSTVPGQ